MDLCSLIVYVCFVVFSFIIFWYVLVCIETHVLIKYNSNKVQKLRLSGWISLAIKLLLSVGHLITFTFAHNNNLLIKI